MTYKIVLFILCLSTFLNYGCKSEEEFPSIGTNIAGPADVAVSEDGNHFYVLNTDFDRYYNEGSILILTKAGEKLDAMPMRRLGRGLNLFKRRLLVIFDRLDIDGEGAVELYHVSEDGKALTKVQTWSVDCAPIGMAQDNDYFAVSCIGGKVFMGRYPPGSNAAVPSAVDDENLSTLDHVRSYGYSRRALHLYDDGVRRLLFSFPTDMAQPNSKDLNATDEKRYDTASEQLVDGSNDVPDTFEETARKRKRLSSRLPYQMAIYDINAELEISRAGAGEAYETFRHIGLGTLASPTVANFEMRFIKYDISGRDRLEGDENLFRTNFWEVKGGGESQRDQIYLSQRGEKSSPNSNNVVQFTFKPENLGSLTEEIVDPTTGTGKFSDFMTDAKRLYGLKGEGSDNDYIGDFEIFNRDASTPYLVFNHFRDLVYWSRDEQMFGIGAKDLSVNQNLIKANEIQTDDFRKSYYQIAVNAEGRGITGSYYNNSVILFDVSSEAVIKEFLQVF